MLHSSIEPLYLEFETTPFKNSGFRELLVSVHDAIRCEASGQSQISLIGEAIALNLSTDFLHSSEGWGTFFGPMNIYQDEDRNICESPSLQMINQEVLDYWLSRASDAKHPLLKARYAHAVWDLTRAATGNKPPFPSLKMSVNAYSQASQCITGAEWLDQEKWLERAVALARRVKYDQGLNRAFEALVAIATQRHESQALIQSCALMHYRGKLIASQPQLDAIKCGLESCSKSEISELGEGKRIPFLWDDATLYLADYEWHHGSQEAARSLITRYKNAIGPLTDSTRALMATSWTARLHKRLEKYGLQKLANEVAVQLENRSKDIKAELAPITVETEFDRAPICLELDRLFACSMKVAAERLWAMFLPDEGELRSEEKNRPHGLLAFLGGAEYLDDSGRVTRSRPIAASDPEAAFRDQYLDHVSFKGIFLELAFEQFRIRFTEDIDRWDNLILSSPRFNPAEREKIRVGVAAYLDGDFLTSVHILVPTIESVLRNLNAAIGSPAWKIPKRPVGNERQVRLLHEVLASKEIMAALGTDWILYLRLVLSDSKGMNIRNNVCHGLLAPADFDRGVNEILIHIIFGLALGAHQQSKDSASDAHAPIASPIGPGEQLPFGYGV